mmetsp:Transcript_103651/g.268162  ORF Transcript_103651/g.268162 Transcript_103651/m.268162 type:complete len:261 (+) Transcript_103651:348-1130(+)
MAASMPAICTNERAIAKAGPGMVHAMPEQRVVSRVRGTTQFATSAGIHTNVCVRPPRLPPTPCGGGVRATLYEGRQGRCYTGESQQGQQAGDVVGELVVSQSTQKVTAWLLMAGVLREPEKCYEHFALVDEPCKRTEQDDRKLHDEKTSHGLRSKVAEESARAVIDVRIRGTEELEPVLKCTAGAVGHRAGIGTGRTPTVEASPVNPLGGAAAQARLDQVASLVEAEAAHASPAFDWSGAPALFIRIGQHHRWWPARAAA